MRKTIAWQTTSTKRIPLGTCIVFRRRFNRWLESGYIGERGVVLFEPFAKDETIPFSDVAEWARLSAAMPERTETGRKAVEGALVRWGYKKASESEYVSFISFFPESAEYYA